MATVLVSRCYCRFIDEKTEDNWGAWSGDTHMLVSCRERKDSVLRIPDLSTSLLFHFPGMCSASCKGWKEYVGAGWHSYGDLHRGRHATKRERDFSAKRQLRLSPRGQADSNSTALKLNSYRGRLSSWKCFPPGTQSNIDKNCSPLFFAVETQQAKFVWLFGIFANRALPPVVSLPWPRAPPDLGEQTSPGFVAGPHTFLRSVSSCFPASISERLFALDLALS